MNNLEKLQNHLAGAKVMNDRVTREHLQDQSDNAKLEEVAYTDGIVSGLELAIELLRQG